LDGEFLPNAPLKGQERIDRIKKITGFRREGLRMPIRVILFILQILLILSSNTRPGFQVVRHFEVQLRNEEKNATAP
jgi:hypothetical protein